MKPDFRKLKVSLIFAILFSSILITVAILDKDSETASAQLFGGFGKTNIEMEATGNGTLNPERQAIFDITVEYELMAPADIGEKVLYFPPTKAKLEVKEGDTEWLTASLSRRTFTITPEKQETVRLTVDITPEAPYLEQHIITLEAIAFKKLPNIANFRFSY